MRAAGMGPWRMLLLACSLLLVAVATLTPGVPSVATAAPGIWCLACGAAAGADVTTNVLLFLPLGAALVMCGVRPAPAFAGGVLLSVLIECLQHSGLVPARVPNATDVLTNGLGTALGALLARFSRAWLLPEGGHAGPLAVATGIGVTALLGFTAWALAPDVRGPASALPNAGPTAPLRTSTLPFTPGHGWYHGRVVEGVVNGVRVQRTGDGPLILMGEAGLRPRVRLVVSGRDERTGFTPMLYLHRDGDSTAQLMLGQQGSALGLIVRLRGSRLGLGAPELLLPAAFPDSARVAIVSAAVEPGRWVLEAERDGAARGAGLRLTVALGWALFQTVIGTSSAWSWVLSCLWLATLFLPLGYRCAGGPGGTSALRVAASVLPALALVVAPLLASIAPTPPRDALSALAGYTLGVLLRQRVRRRFVPPRAT